MQIASEGHDVARPSRRRLLRVTFAGAGAVAASAAGALASACAPSATAPQASTGPSSAAPQAWEREWEDLVAAAKREGKLGLITITGVGYRKWIEVFQQAFPGIEVQHHQFSVTAQLTPRIMQGRAAGVYEWDLMENSSSYALPILRPESVLAPTKPLIMTRPDVRDDKAWYGGFEAGWLDHGKELGYAYQVEVGGVLAINTDQVAENEIKTVDDLLQPKWKGKIFWSHVNHGGTFGPMNAVRLKRGEETVKRLIVDQQPKFSRDTRLITEALVRGQYAMASGSSPAILQEFHAAGVGKNVKFIEVRDYSYLSFYGTLWYFNQAPHPNAAKLFLNWTLTKEGQASYVKHVQRGSRRLDVDPADPVTVPKPGVDYVSLGPEQGLDEVNKTKAFLEKLVPD